MGAVKVIINKELKAAFNSLLIYIAYTAFLCVTGFVCWFSGKNIFSSGQASLSNLFNVFYWTLFFLIPALTMKSISEERKDGTFELLFSKPIKTWQLIMGKFFAILLQVVTCLALTLPYYITIASLGNVDHAVAFAVTWDLFWSVDVTSVSECLPRPSPQTRSWPSSSRLLLR